MPNEPNETLQAYTPFAPAMPPRAAVSPHDGPVPLTKYIWVLRRYRWRLLAFMAVCMVATLIVSSQLTRVYEASATIDIDRKMPTGLLGPEAAQGSAIDADQFLATQAKLIASDSVLRPVVRKYRLRELEGQEAEPGLPRASQEDAPLTLKKLRVNRPPNTYLLQISYRSPDPQISANVANAIADSYIRHTHNLRYRASESLSAFMEKQLEQLKANVEASSGKLAQFERELNLINPEERTTILSARLLQLNTEFTAAQADRLRKETAHTSVANGSLEAAQVSTQGETLRKTAERLNEAQERFGVAKAQYGPNHPEYKKVAQQVSELEATLQRTRGSIARRIEIEYRQAISREELLREAVAKCKREYDGMNARQFAYQALKRDAEADKKLYEELLRKIKEAGINAGFQNSAIRIADPARPPVKPVFPNLKLNLLLAFVFSGLLGFAGGVVAHERNCTIRDAEDAWNSLGTEVLGSLPLVRGGRKLLAAANASEAEMKRLPAVSRHVYEEAIQTLCSTVLLMGQRRRVVSVLVTSAVPGEGKTSTACHLAVAGARKGQRTLLVDADLRRPMVHRYFGIEGLAGLADVCASEAEWTDVARAQASLPNLTVLPAGHGRSTASLHLHKTLPRILAEAGRDFDLVVVDSPPILGFPEPLEMATVVDAVAVITRAGQTDRKAVAAGINALRRVRANVLGLVLNEVTRSTSESYYYGYDARYYRYYNRRKPA